MKESRLKEYIDINPKVKLQKGEVYSSIEMEKITVGRKIADANSKAEYTGKSCSKFLPNDTLMARITPCLENGKIAKYESDTAGFGSTEFFILRAKKKKTTADYVYYLSNTHYVRRLAVNSMTGASGRQRADAKFIGNIKWDFPEIGIQSKVADILSAYDNLIENNNKRIKLLEQMAENLYKEWFVRFRFLGYEDVEFVDGIPEGWKRIKLRKLINKSGKSIKKENLEVSYKYVPIDFINSKSIVLRKCDDLENASSSLQIFQEKDILFGAMRPYFHKVSIADFKGVTRSTCFVIRPIDEDYLYYVLMMLFQESTVNFATTISVGSTMPYVRWEDFVRMNTLKPTKSVISDFSRKIVPVIKEMNILVAENELLEKQRDLLLPRLMSGKLEV